MGEYDVEPGSKMVAIDVKGDDVSSIMLESLTLPTNVYINILEVSDSFAFAGSKEPRAQACHKSPSP